MARKRRGNKQFEARQIQLLRWRIEAAKLEIKGCLKEKNVYLNHRRPI